jgi:hypothetical protein
MPSHIGADGGGFIPDASITSPFEGSLPETNIPVQMDCQDCEWTSQGSINVQAYSGNIHATGPVMTYAQSHEASTGHNVTVSHAPTEP